MALEKKMRTKVRVKSSFATLARAQALEGRENRRARRQTAVALLRDFHWMSILAQKRLYSSASADVPFTAAAATEQPLAAQSDVPASWAAVSAEVANEPENTVAAPAQHICTVKTLRRMVQAN